MKNAIITGATHGIGKAIAKACLSENMSVCLCARNLNELKQLQSDFKTQFPSLDIHVFQADFLQPEQVKKFADFCLEKLESIDMLVNNAGQFIPNDIADEPENMLSEMMQINLFAPYHLSRFLL